MTKSRVLILLPVLNESKNLDRLISSIRGQTHENFLLLIQDNKSEDDTLGIARYHESQDDRIQVFSNDSVVSGGENWFSMILKVPNIGDFDYCCFQAGDDDWSDNCYLNNLVELLDKNPSVGAATPEFRIVNSRNEELKSIKIDLDYKYASKRIWELCKNWDYVHLIYGLYRRDAFIHLLECKVSRFTDYPGNDWWWTYEFLSRDRSLRSVDSSYNKLLEPVVSSTPVLVNRGRIHSYLYSVYVIYKPSIIHLSRLRNVKKKIHLIGIPVGYFVFTASMQLIRMHIEIINRRFFDLRRKWS